MRPMPPTTLLAAIGLAVAGSLATGCAATGSDAARTAGAESSAPAGSGVSPTPGSGASPSAPATDPVSPTPTTDGLPTLRPPTAPPDKPTDTRPDNQIVGRVTRGGSGPCYTVVTDDGTEYALYGQDAGPLLAGSYVRVSTGPMRLRIDCGPGTPRSIVAVDPVR
jgi:hypothetical protein